MSLLGKSWRYISEGNVHIVLSIVGTGHVLRLMKENGEAIDLDSVRKSVSFVNQVMIPLLSVSETDMLKVLTVPSHELHQLVKDLLEFRPENRRSKSVLSPYAVRAPNLTMLNDKSAINYCLEIKPKEGFMASCFRKYAKCYYCLQQFKKLKEGSIKEMNQYCPLDLFSGDRSRMRHALLALVDNPQNNLKLFHNGSIVYHDNSERNHFDSIIQNIDVLKGSVDLFLDFIIEILLNENQQSTVALNKIEHNKVRIKRCVEESSLQPNTVLYKILKLQKITEFQKIQLDNVGTTQLEYVSEILNQIQVENLNLNNEEYKDVFLSTSKPKHSALISAVAKDLSIMISFSPLCQEGCPAVLVDGCRIPYRVALTDLEPKPPATLAKRQRTEQTLLDLYGGYLQREERAAVRDRGQNNHIQN